MKDPKSGKEIREPSTEEIARGICSLKGDHKACEDPAPTFEVRATIGADENIYGPFSNVENAEKCVIALAGRNPSGDDKFLRSVVWEATIVPVLNKEGNK